MYSVILVVYLFPTVVFFSVFFPRLSPRDRRPCCKDRPRLCRSTRRQHWKNPDGCCRITAFSRRAGTGWSWLQRSTWPSWCRTTRVSSTRTNRPWSVTWSSSRFLLSVSRTIFINSHQQQQRRSYHTHCSVFICMYIRFVIAYDV